MGKMLPIRWISIDHQKSAPVAIGVISSGEDASLRVDENHSLVEGGQASKRSLGTVFHLNLSRLQSAVGVTEAQLPRGVVSQHPEAFFGLCHEKVIAKSYLDDWRDSFHSLWKSARPREIGKGGRGRGRGRGGACGVPKASQENAPQLLQEF